MGVYQDCETTLESREEVLVAPLTIVIAGQNAVEFLCNPILYFWMPGQKVHCVCEHCGCGVVTCEIVDEDIAEDLIHSES